MGKTQRNDQPRSNGVINKGRQTDTGLSYEENRSYRKNKREADRRDRFNNVYLED